MAESDPNAIRRDVSQLVKDEAARFVELVNAIDKAKKSKPADLEEFRRLLKTYPDLWRVAGNLAALAEMRLIDNIATQPSVQEAIRFGMQKHKTDLGNDNASPLERLLIEQVALCWLRLNVTEWKHAASTTGGASIAQATYWDKALSAAQRRYLRALEALARVQRLMRPGAVQVNIGQTVQAAQLVKPKDE